jgi:TRAP-type C4-dicarboxylate transport system permease small subunit
MKRVITFLEYVGGGLLFVVMVLITASAFCRYALNAPLLDSDDLARLLLLPAIFFGLAGACHHGEHIQVDLLWETLSPRNRQLLDRFSLLIMTVCVGTMAYASVHRVFDIQASRVGTYELRLPLWPFFALASAGLVFSAVVLARRLLRPTIGRLETNL